MKMACGCEDGQHEPDCERYPDNICEFCHDGADVPHFDCHRGPTEAKGDKNKMTTALVAARDGRKTEGVPTEGLILMVGHPKSGKSTTAAKFPGAYVLMLEDRGGDRINGKGLRIHDIKDEWDGEVLVKTKLDNFGDVLELALASDDVQTIVIDSVDQLADMIGNDVALKMGMDPKDAKPQEKNFTYWGALKTRLEGLCDFLKNSGKLVILVAHCKAPEKDDKGRITTPAGINVSGKGGNYICAQAEAIAYISKRSIGGKMVQYMSFNAPSDIAIWGSRIEELEGKEFVIPKDEPYSAFAAQFAPAKKPAAPTLKKKSR